MQVQVHSPLTEDWHDGTLHAWLSVAQRAAGDAKRWRPCELLRRRNQARTWPLRLPGWAARRRATHLSAQYARNRPAQQRTQLGVHGGVCSPVKWILAHVPAPCSTERGRLPAFSFLLWHPLMLRYTLIYIATRDGARHMQGACMAVLSVLTCRRDHGGGGQDGHVPAASTVQHSTAQRLSLYKAPCRGSRPACSARGRASHAPHQSLLRVAQQGGGAEGEDDAIMRVDCGAWGMSSPHGNAHCGHC